MVATVIYSVTNLPWCCGKKPDFLFAELWKGDYYYFLALIFYIPSRVNASS